MLDVCVRNINCTLIPHERKDPFFGGGGGREVYLLVPVQLD